MKYTNYQTARDLAWSTLIKHNVGRLPVKISSMMRAEGIQLLSYSKGWEIISALHLEKAAQNDGFATIIFERRVVLFDDSKPVCRQRFTCAHELGHHLLGHTMQSTPSGALFTVCNREESDFDEPEEHEANVFASRLLAPSCVLRELEAYTPQEISALCGISLEAASIRSERLKLLCDRDAKFIAERGHRCFYQSPLEREVSAQFSEYIKETRDRCLPPRENQEE